MNRDTVWKKIGIMAAAYVVCLGVLVGIFVFAANVLITKTVEEGGLKPAIEKIWCGEAGCMAEES